MNDMASSLSADSFQTMDQQMAIYHPHKQSLSTCVTAGSFRW